MMESNALSGTVVENLGLITFISTLTISTMIH